MLGARLTAGGQRTVGGAGNPQAPTAQTARSSDPGRPVDTHLFRDIADQLNPIVAFITTESKVTAEILPTVGDEFFRRFFGESPTRPHDQIQRALGSGFIVSETGEILTNNHVVADADRIRVALLLDETKRYDAKVLGRDPLTNTALIKVDKAPAPCPSPRLATPTRFSRATGSWRSVTPSISGTRSRLASSATWDGPSSCPKAGPRRLVQSDVSINPGNSGGPLIDTDGHVVGINAAILGNDEGGNIGIGFAVPINTAKTLLP